MNPFEFKPGHKVFLLQLPTKIKLLKKEKHEQSSVSEKYNFSHVLKTFIDTSQANFGKNPKGYRYNETNRHFSTFIYLLCGRACYETLHANLPIPTANTIREFTRNLITITVFNKEIFSVGYINEHKPRIIEGELRCKQLKRFLEVLEVPLRVWLSEDASGIVSKIEFDPQTNQMIGIVLPMDSSTGMPTAFTYLARNAEEIELNMRQNKSTLVYVVMAQPLVKNVPPFILQLFGTNNKFKTSQVLQRWKHTINALNR